MQTPSKLAISKFISLSLLVVLSLLLQFCKTVQPPSIGSTPRSQSLSDSIDYEVLKIANFAGLTGNENAVKIHFPDLVEPSKIVFSYAYEKYPDDIKVDTFYYDAGSTVGEPPKGKYLHFKDKRTSTKLNVAYTGNSLSFAIPELDKSKKKSKFLWGSGVRQPKMYPARKQDKKRQHKRRYNKWCLLEVAIYSKTKPQWLGEKDKDSFYPRLHIENMLLGYAEKKLGRDRTAGNDGVNPRITINHLQRVKAVHLFDPSAAEQENCTQIGYRHNGVEYVDFGTIELGGDKKSMEIELLNKNGYYAEKHVACKPKIELLFQVPNRPEKADLEIIDKNQIVLRDSVVSFIPPTFEPIVFPCEHGSIDCGRIMITFTPGQRITKIYQNKQYEVINHKVGRTDSVIIRRPTFDTTITNTATIKDIYIKKDDEPAYRKINFASAGNTYVIKSLNSGFYDLRLEWEMEGVDIDTTIYTALDTAYKKINIPTITTRDTQFLSLQIPSGGNREPTFNLVPTEIEEEIISTGTLAGINDYAVKRLDIAIDRSSNKKYLAVGLSREDMGEIKLKGEECIIDTDVYGNPDDFGKLKFSSVSDASLYTDNEIYWDKNATGKYEKNGDVRVSEILLFDLEKMGYSVSFLAEDLSEEKKDTGLSIFYRYIILIPKESE